MNIYKVINTVTSGYDTFDSMIVFAKDKKEARTIHPYDNEIKNAWGSSSWCSKEQINKLQVVLIGVNFKRKRKGVILASFNAG